MIKINSKISIKLLITIAMSIFIIFISTNIYAKYVFQNEFYIANLNIDRTKPKIELVSITNSNTSYKDYANKTHTITIKVKITDKNLKDVFLDNKHIKISDKNIKCGNIKSSKIQDVIDGGIYQIELTNVEGDGNLKIDILEGTAIDVGGLENKLFEINTNIIIDNTAPKGEFSENKITDGKVKVVIKLSEKIKDIEGWKLSNDKLTAEKEFTNNISYELPIVDYAGNKSTVNINVTKATYINIVYASHNSVVGWSFGYGNYDVAGKDAIAEDPIHKTEALAFNISGNIDSDFVQAKSYIYTYWGEGTYARCKTSGILYNYGYNPLDESYKSMKSKDLVTIGDKKYFQLGGSGLNETYNTDINGNKPMPNSVANEFKYGISGIKFKLKDYSQFSVVYQILIDKVGWINACSDGQECMYAKDKPMSAFRIVLVPKTEKQYVIDTWNQDVGTFNMK